MEYTLTCTIATAPDNSIIALGWASFRNACDDVGGTITWIEAGSSSPFSMTVAEASTLMPLIALALGTAWGFRLLVNQLLNK